MGSVRVDKSGYFYLDFYYMGVRCREGTHLKDAPKNRKWLENKLKAIEEEILRGEFDYEAHFPEGNKLSVFGRKRIEGRVLMKDFAESWFKEKISALKLSTILTHRSSLRYIVSYFGNHCLDQITEADINLFRSELAGTKTNRGGVLQILPVKMVFFLRGILVKRNKVREKTSRQYLGNPKNGIFL